MLGLQGAFDWRVRDSDNVNYQVKSFSADSRASRKIRGTHVMSAKWLDNLKVSKKLGLGFAAILLGVLTVTAIGYSSTNLLIERMGKSSKVAEIKADVLNARIAAQAYATGPTAAGVQNYASALDTLSRSVDQGLQVFVISSNLAKLRDIKEQVGGLKQTFNQLVGINQKVDEALKPIIKVSDDVSATFENLLNKTIDDTLRSPNETGIRQVKIAGDLRNGMTNFRLVFRRYLSVPNADNRQATYKSADALIAQVDAARSQLPVEANAAVDAALVALKQYKVLMSSISDMLQQTEQVRTDLQQQSIATAARADDLAALQVISAKKEQQTAVVQLLSVALVVLLVGIFAAFLITRQITVPLNSTVIAARRIADGDLTHDSSTTRQDELGLLQNTMQHMTVSLRGLIGGIGNGVTQIATAAEQLSAVSEQTSAGVTLQKNEVDQVATAMNEMASTVQEVARNTEDASLAAKQASERAAHGSSVVQHATREIGQLAGEVKQLGEAMQRLTEDSGKIGSVIDVIKAVAEQTNLLALNAAIEAARAGEQGRGFAVVADEVRSLAQRTQNSTTEIEALIQALQKGTGAASGLMDASLQRTEGTVVLARQAEQALVEINQSIGTIEQMSQQISAAAEQQSAVTDEINRSVLSVRDIADQSASATEQSAASTVELARLGSDLQSMVARFKI
ncbi:Histidine kinase, HAMP region:Bacterial chemotaxis sensory transducer [Pseudomonas savastanoi pv. glycinea]|uniref:Histidine kinase, HAMP region:Bacterial chemotaxis sensory transducer n=1 Tax=Pseudomonas savastanoi pv. glycinea TaxID=318 RepID=A0A3M4HVN6_PSESG|nr:Histidine kinase, HAMP region:Bacterial chemotaxis sensory transducer [Pseudomonas savastanoi pv. glycinea]RMT12346.1 Histidine kinase, HAMP region:Bacterial chemotaxis sensory transducer [Pseudomonas savastanoi pv. phaseolicola]RMP96552.1 Histidine kinase, HAMP region:Bacterial chemotaxis sensory transducer [Pseudomonas savastanoi pv. glycinea]RMP98893.1 Histidine kinase, HAMP region:Bacterial chemotaxis sensory transducer [Pseudomonas savastanoi pv. glycinea]RMQ51097.1 Histidine kinase, HA